MRSSFFVCLHFSPLQNIYLCVYITPHCTVGPTSILTLDFSSWLSLTVFMILIFVKLVML